MTRLNITWNKWPSGEKTVSATVQDQCLCRSREVLLTAIVGPGHGLEYVSTRVQSWRMPRILQVAYVSQSTSTPPPLTLWQAWDPCQTTR